MFPAEITFNDQNLAHLLIEGEAGAIETVINKPKDFTASKAVVVFCHPHPLHGGSLTNKVVHMLSMAFVDMGHVVVRFNFRGVGQSGGSFDHGVGEATDLIHVAKTVQGWLPGAPVWLAGFSFGAYVATRAHRQAGAEKLLLVAPPVSMYDFDELGEISVPWMVMQGSADEVIDANAVKNWLKKQQNPPGLAWLEGGSHFFHGQLNWLKETIKSSWPDL